MNNPTSAYAIAEYVLGAMAKARYVELEDGGYYADVFLCPGVWATGETVEECRDELQDILMEWLTAAYEDQDLPPELTELTWISPLWLLASD